MGSVKHVIVAYDRKTELEILEVSISSRQMRRLMSELGYDDDEIFGCYELKLDFFLEQRQPNRSQVIMTDKIEQVARAMFEREPDHGPWDQASTAQQVIYLSDAHAAIEAIREMIIQAVRYAPALDENGYIATKDSILREIDAALKGEP